MQFPRTSKANPLLSRFKNDLEPYYKSPQMVGRFFLPTVLLASGALLNNPVIATTVATAGATLALADRRYGLNKIDAPLLGTAILLAATSSSLRGVWNSVGTDRWIYGANALISTPLILYRIYLYKENGLFNTYNKTHLAQFVSLLFFPLVCFEMRQILPPSFAAVGMGIATLGATQAGHSYKKKNQYDHQPLELLPLAYGTAFAYFGISQFRFFSGSWTDRLAYSAAMILHASPLFLYLGEVASELKQSHPQGRKGVRFQ